MVRSNCTLPLRSPLRLSLLALALALAAPAPPVAAAPARTGADHGGDAAAARGRFAINLYRPGDFAPQRTQYWCVGASMQMMLNIIGLTDDDSRAGQVRYMRLARRMGPPRRVVDHGLPPLPGAAGLRGAGSSGWARGLTSLGAGRYEERVLDRYDQAVSVAVNALRRTGRPVGLIVWRGAHAWVMSGFTATADPLSDRGYRVTGVYIQDPWYPRVSSSWGRGKKPNSWVSIRALKGAFLPRHGGRWHREQAGKFVLVVPVDAAKPSAVTRPPSELHRRSGSPEARPRWSMIPA